MRNKVITGPPETKVALPAAVGLVISFILAAIQFYAPAFRSPPAALVSMGITAIGLVVGYIAPHTAIPLENVSPTVLQVTASKVELNTATPARIGPGGGVS